MRTWLGTVGSAAIASIGGLAIWSLMSSNLPWSTVFSRMWVMAAIGLGVASLAAIIRGARTVELPAGSERWMDRNVRKRGRPDIAWALAPGLAVLMMVEAVAILQMFTEFRRETVALRSSLAFVLGGWVIGSLVVQLAGKRISVATLLQASVGASAITLVISLALREFSTTSWIPDSVSGHETVSLAMYLFGFLVGLAACWRRTGMPAVTGNTEIGTASALVIGLIAAAVPTIFVWATDALTREATLVIGLGFALAVLIGAGFVRTPGSGQSSRASSISGQFAASANQ
jgi:hypothetical protein